MKNYFKTRRWKLILLFALGLFLTGLRLHSFVFLYQPIRDQLRSGIESRAGISPGLRKIGRFPIHADHASLQAHPQLVWLDAQTKRTKLLELQNGGASSETELPRGLQMKAIRLKSLMQVVYEEETRSFVKPWRQFWTEIPETVWVADLQDDRAEALSVGIKEVLLAMQAIRRHAKKWNQIQLMLKQQSAQAGLMRYFGSGISAAVQPLPEAWLNEGARSILHSTLCIPAFIGWLNGSQPILFSGGKIERDAMLRWTETLSRLNISAPIPSRACVSLNIQNEQQIVINVKTGMLAESGPLLGFFQVRWGKFLSKEFLSNGEISLLRENGQNILQAELPLNEYLARGVDHSGFRDQSEAAKALSIIARSKIKSARIKLDSNCYQDSSADASWLSPATQRSRSLVSWSEGMYAGASARMPSSNTGSEFRKSFEVGSAKGLFYDEILSRIGYRIEIR